MESKPGVAVAVAGTLALPGYGEKVRRQSGVHGTGSGHQAREEGRTAAAALIGSPGINANGMARNPVNGRPGGAVRRVSQCQSAGSDPFQHGTAFTHSAFSAWLICAQCMAWGTVPGNVTIKAGP